MMKNTQVTYAMLPPALAGQKIGGVAKASENRCSFHAVIRVRALPLPKHFTRWRHRRHAIDVEPRHTWLSRRCPAHHIADERLSPIEGGLPIECRARQRYHDMLAIFIAI